MTPFCVQQTGLRRSDNLADQMAPIEMCHFTRTHSSPHLQVATTATLSEPLPAVYSNSIRNALGRSGSVLNNANETMIVVRMNILQVIICRYQK